MYVAVKGGEKAIAAAHQAMDAWRRGKTTIPSLTTGQIQAQMPLAVSRVMAEGALYDPQLAALAIKQAAGDLVEAIFLLRAYRTTLPRWYQTIPLETAQMRIARRISAVYKDIPGGQILGPTFDYSHRLLDFSLLEEEQRADFPQASLTPETQQELPLHVSQLLENEDLIEKNPQKSTRPGDLTRDPLSLPADRSTRLQNLARGDEGFLLSLAYSTQRGYGNSHPFVGEIRYGFVEVSIYVEELGFEVCIGELEITECEMINQFEGSKHQPPAFTRGYGLSFGYNERKTLSMSLVDRALRDKELGKDIDSPAQDEEFVMYHSDSVEAAGFVTHLKLPHYVDFQSELNMIRRLRENAQSESKK